MTSLNNKYTNNRSMNGLINIYADNIEATNSTINDTLIVDGKDINTVANQVDTNKINLTGITYTPTPVPTTNISNKLYAYEDATFEKNLYVNKNNTNNTSSLDVNGTIYFREPSNPNVLYMSIKYEPTLAGWRFMNENPNGYMYFSTKNSAGTIRSFQFNSGQLYSNIFTYIDNGFTISFNNQIVLGDSNGIGTWAGARQIYIPNASVTSGLVFYNKGLSNNVAYY